MEIREVWADDKDKELLQLSSAENHCLQETGGYHQVFRGSSEELRLNSFAGRVEISLQSEALQSCSLITASHRKQNLHILVANNHAQVSLLQALYVIESR